MYDRFGADTTLAIESGCINGIAALKLSTPEGSQIVRTSHSEFICHPSQGEIK